MKDTECVQFLQWALPRLHMRWPGFRKVRGQVCKRLAGRLKELMLADASDYCTYLETHADEWRLLDSLCRVTISRFYREKAVFQFLEQRVIPALIDNMTACGENQFNVLCLGSASGEEPYTIAILWQLQFQDKFPGMTLNIIATEADSALILRGGQACYPYSSIKNLPEAWRLKAFDNQDDLYCLKTEFRSGVQFLQQDIRAMVPAGPFDLILCRNLVFTYFDEPLQQRILCQIVRELRPQGALVIGIHEALPESLSASHPVPLTLLSPWSGRLGIFKKTSALR